MHSDVVQRAYASEHLKYDALMLRATQELLQRPNLPEALGHALLESFTLATRRLMEFFYEEPGGDGDARATQYCKGGDWTATKPRPLWKVTARINQEIAHASLERVTLSEETRAWNTGEMRRALEETFKDFVKLAYPDLIPNRTRAVLLDDGYANVEQKSRTAYVSATNTTLSESFPSLLRKTRLPPARAGVDSDLTLTSTRALTPEDIAQIHFAPESQST